jgi:hypothetical protein
MCVYTYTVSYTILATPAKVLAREPRGRSALVLAPLCDFPSTYFQAISIQMESELDQIARAILIASDPSQGSLHSQALDYVSKIQQNADDTWRLALALFVDIAPDGARKYSPQARFFGLQILDNFLDDQ